MSDLLLDSETDLAVFKVLKDYSKELARPGNTEARQAAATVIYYAAIASALLFHGEEATQQSYVKLHETFGDLEEKKWVPPQLKNLFRDAKAVGQQRKGKTR